MLAACFFLVLLTLIPSPGRAQPPASQGIKVPYGLSWGDTIEKVREMLHAVKAQEVALSEKSPGKNVLEAEGLGVGDALLRKSLFKFKDGSLIEVELQYGDPSWDSEKTLDFFDRTRRRIDERYGPGTLLVNKVKERPSTDNVPRSITYTLIIYQWTQPAAALELSFYSVEDAEKSYRLVSLHYKTP
jgi:hypothetical protein